MEACGSAHYWARELAGLGHEVRLMPPQYVRPYVKTNKHDAADAEAICEAVTRPTMRFVPVKSVEQQAERGHGADRHLRAADALGQRIDVEGAHQTDAEDGNLQIGHCGLPKSMVAPLQELR